jgi:hypothetical protein
MELEIIESWSAWMALPSYQNLMKIYQAAQKLLVEDTQTDRLAIW